MKEYDIKVQNIIVTADLGRKVDLDKLSKLPNIEYDPSILPVAILTMQDIGFQALISSNGIVTINHLINEKQAEEAMLIIDKLIEGGKE